MPVGGSWIRSGIWEVLNQAWGCTAQRQMTPVLLPLPWRGAVAWRDRSDPRLARPRGRHFGARRRPGQPMSNHASTCRSAARRQLLRRHCDSQMRAAARPKAIFAAVLPPRLLVTGRGVITDPSPSRTDRAPVTPLLPTRPPPRSGTPMAVLPGWKLRTLNPWVTASARLSLTG
jgi:hypothetical protein